MQTFLEYYIPLTEVFDKPLKIQWYKTKYEWDGSFKTNSEKYDINIRMLRKNNKEFWEVEFSGHGSDMEISGVGNQFQVFATVLSGINDFLKEVAPDMLVFSSVKNKNETGMNSRDKLYDRLTKRYINQRDYTFKVSTMGQDRIYTITKK